MNIVAAVRSKGLRDLFCFCTGGWAQANACCAAMAARAVFVLTVNPLDTVWLNGHRLSREGAGRCGSDYVSRRSQGRRHHSYRCPANFMIMVAQGFKKRLQEKWSAYSPASCLSDLSTATAVFVTGLSYEAAILPSLWREAGSSAMAHGRAMRRLH